MSSIDVTLFQSTRDLVDTSILAVLSYDGRLNHIHTLHVRNPARPRAHNLRMCVEHAIHTYLETL